MMDKGKGLPALGAEVVPGNGMAPAGHGTNHPAPFHPQVEAAAATAVTANRQHILHSPLILFASIAGRSSIK
jgi:hypothetical protein